MPLNNLQLFEIRDADNRTVAEGMVFSDETVTIHRLNSHFPPFTSVFASLSDAMRVYQENHPTWKFRFAER